eukprot:5977450-Pyramimonas_sp.AAC.1
MGASTSLSKVDQLASQGQDFSSRSTLDQLAQTYTHDTEACTGNGRPSEGESRGRRRGGTGKTRRPRAAETSRREVLHNDWPLGLTGPRDRQTSGGR